MNSQIRLETKYVGSLRGRFFIPSYQRGYRWGRDEVLRLLEDIYSNGNQSYSLQPIVVKRQGEVYELIDGQQRLTTLYLIYRHMHEASLGFLDQAKFTLSFETREKSGDFLRTLDCSKGEENIDYWFICNAYQVIGEWFRQREAKSTLTNMNKYFDEHVKLIWYEAEDGQDSISLFTRLNIGKIPLTSAELVKAMFLSRDKVPEMTKGTQEEISMQWDSIERALQDNALWYFLTNRENREFQTRIDLILDLMAGKKGGEKDKYFTFFHFDALRQRESLQVIWGEIQHTFLILKDWFEDHELYHKIGYLIASESRTLREIFQLSKEAPDGKGLTKQGFKGRLDELIRESLEISGNYGELSYEKPGHHGKLTRLLLLFNVESVRKNGENTQWFPFEKFKFRKHGRARWSLEHIHAQQAEGMKKQEQWKEWLRLHLPSLQALEGDHKSLLTEVEAFMARQPLERVDFQAAQEQILRILSPQGEGEYIHTIGNLALLDMGDNAALQNAAFDVKRNIIIEMDKKGQYIPFCTRMVFLKYYTPSAYSQLHFWGQEDRLAYIQAMNTMLAGYIREEIRG